MRRIAKWLCWIAAATMLFVLVAATARGQCYGGQCYMPRHPTEHLMLPKTDTLPFCIRVQCGSSRASGTIISDSSQQYDYVLTCWHVMRGEPGRFVILLNDGRRVPAERVGSNRAADWLVLRCRPLGIKGARTALQMDNYRLAVNDPVAIYGWDMFGRFVRQNGRITNLTLGNGMFESSNTPPPGLSGGCVVGPQNVIVGVITGTDGRMCVGPCLPRLRAALRAILPPYRRRLVAIPQNIPQNTPPQSPQTIVMPPSGINGEIAAIRQEIADLELTPGPPGKDGARGPPGQDGVRGPPGKDGAIPLALLKQLIADEFALLRRELAAQKQAHDALDIKMGEAEVVSQQARSAAEVAAEQSAAAKQTADELDRNVKALQLRVQRLETSTAMGVDASGKMRFRLHFDSAGNVARVEPLSE
jgi:hypothetical protein